MKPSTRSEGTVRLLAATLLTGALLLSRGNAGQADPRSPTSSSSSSSSSMLGQSSYSASQPFNFEDALRNLAGNPLGAGNLWGLGAAWEYMAPWVSGWLGDGSGTPAGAAGDPEYWRKQQALGNAVGGVLDAGNEADQARQDAENAAKEAQNKQKKLEDARNQLDQDRRRLRRLENDLGNLVKNFVVRNEDDREAIRQATADLSRRIREQTAKVNQQKQAVQNAEGDRDNANRENRNAQGRLQDADGRLQAARDQAQRAKEEAQNAQNEAQRREQEARDRAQREREERERQERQERERLEQERQRRDREAERNRHEMGIDLRWQGIYGFRYVDPQRQILDKLLLMPNSERGALGSNQAFLAAVDNHNYERGKEGLVKVAVTVTSSCFTGSVGRLLDLSLAQKVALTAGIAALKTTPEIVNHMKNKLGPDWNVQAQPLNSRSFSGMVVTLYNRKTGEYSTTGDIRPTGGSAGMRTAHTTAGIVDRPSTFTVHGRATHPEDR